MTAPAETRYQFTGTIRGLGHPAICARLRRRHQPWLMRWGVLVAALGYAVVLVGLIAVANATNTRLPSWSSYVPFGIFVVGLVALLRWRHRHVWASVREAPVRRAEQRYDLSEEGLRVTGELGETFLRWPAVLDVIEDPEGLLLLTGQMEYTAIPAGAFRDAAEMRQTREQVARWIDAARDGA